MRKKTEKVYCDLCGKFIGEFSEAEGCINIFQITKGKHWANNEKEKDDICDECLSRFLELKREIIKGTFK
jgi:hypothetical protein